MTNEKTLKKQESLIGDSCFFYTQTYDYSCCLYMLFFITLNSCCKEFILNINILFDFFVCQCIE